MNRYAAALLILLIVAGLSACVDWKPSHEAQVAPEKE